jgi:hypothetical protein
LYYSVITVTQTSAGNPPYSFPSYSLSAWEGERTPVAMITCRRFRLRGGASSTAFNSD